MTWIRASAAAATLGYSPQATAASIALEKASGTAVPSNGRATRNLILGANYLQSHILHFYHLAGQDFIQGPDTAPFMPRYAKPDLRLPPAINAVGVDQYVEALEVRAVCHEMVALFGGRMPHVHGIPAGGAAEIPTKEKLVEYAARFKKVRKFVEEKYLPVVYLVGSQYKDLGAFGQGYRNALCVGVFPLDDEGKEFVFKAGAYQDGKDMPFDVKRVTEDVKFSWFADSTSGKPFTKGEQVHIPVIITESGLSDLVYNDFFIGEHCDVDIIAGCGIHNDGHQRSQHDGIHTFYVGKHSKVRYTEKHYGEGSGDGERILNPQTIVYLEEGASIELETVQIKGVDSTIREMEERGYLIHTNTREARQWLLDQGVKLKE